MFPEPEQGFLTPDNRDLAGYSYSFLLGWLGLGMVPAALSLERES
jgi:hypothetical protein